MLPNKLADDEVRDNLAAADLAACSFNDFGIAGFNTNSEKALSFLNTSYEKNMSFISDRKMSTLSSYRLGIQELS